LNHLKTVLNRVMFAYTLPIVSFDPFSQEVLNQLIPLTHEEYLPNMLAYSCENNLKIFADYFITYQHPALTLQ
jgi:hypothetical protein